MPDNRFEKFTKEAKQALIVAQDKAKEQHLNYVGTEHILIGILSQANSMGAQILMNFGVSVENVYLVLKTVGRNNPATPPSQKGWGGLSGFAKKIIEYTEITCQIKPVKSSEYKTKAHRPFYSVFDKSKIKTDFNIQNCILSSSPIKQ
ncbi:MAG TPA: Clp protease N-terminal domain-containing protein, partial [Candidatus Gracilibacteria bacterium]|nr:Clp protease N-terminal domain-containing protein [Candidatus Gracilibacteria bacterium]